MKLSFIIAITEGPLSVLHRMQWGEGWGEVSSF